MMREYTSVRWSATLKKKNKELSYVFIAKLLNFYICMVKPLNVPRLSHFLSTDLWVNQPILQFQVKMRLGRVVQSWVIIPQAWCEIWIQIWKRKKPIQFHSYCLQFDDRMLWKKNRENCSRKCFWTKEKVTGIKICRYLTPVTSR